MVTEQRTGIMLFHTTKVHYFLTSEEFLICHLNQSAINTKKKILVGKESTVLVVEIDPCDNVPTRRCQWLSKYQIVIPTLWQCQHKATQGTFRE